VANILAVLSECLSRLLAYIVAETVGIVVMLLAVTGGVHMLMNNASNCGTRFSINFNQRWADYKPVQN